MKCWAGWNTSGIKIAGRNINNFRYADDTTLVAETEEEQKSLLMKVKMESEKVGLKLNIHYQRNANQNHNEVSSHAGQNGCYQKVYKQ